MHEIVVSGLELSIFASEIWSWGDMVLLRKKGR